MSNKKSSKEYDNTDKSLKKLLISAVDDIFLCAIRARYVGYANITTRQMLTHLYTTYAWGMEEVCVAVAV